MSRKNPITTPESNGAEPTPEPVAVLPAEIRERLAEDLGGQYAELLATLKRAMSESEKDLWLSCRDCGKKSVYAGPDWATRLRAGERWIELALGRLREKPPEEDLSAEILERPVATLDAEERASLTGHLLARYPDVAAKIRREVAEARTAVKPTAPTFVLPRKGRR